MKFSVILPIYNVEAYLKQCIESILQQTYKDYELILVNDGSTDNSPAICNFYEQQDNRIKVIHQTNSGLSMARNNGLALASGEYVMFIDSDDFITSNEFLQKLSAKTENNADQIYFKYSKYLNNSKTLCNCTFSYKNAINESTMAGKLQKLVDADAFYGMAWIKAVRRAVLVDNNILFEKGLLGEDTEWNYHLLLHTKRVEFIDESFLAYRQREGSISQSLKLKNLTDFIYVIQKWSGPINQIDEETLRKALLGSLAKYYSNLLVVYVRVSDTKKKQQKTTIKDLSWLLDYSRSKRPKIIAKIYRLFGFEITIMMLNLLDKLKK